MDYCRRKRHLQQLCCTRELSLLPPVQRDIEGGVDYCRRKVLFVKDKLEQLSQLVSTESVGKLI